MEHWQSRAAITGLVVGTVAYEYICPKDEYISDEVGRIRSHRLGNAIIQAAIWTTAAHLAGVMPEKLDWLHYLTALKQNER